MPSAVSEFHSGERAMHELLKVPRLENPTVPGLPGRYAMKAMQSPLMAVGTLDGQGQPWTSIWGGERGLVQPIAPGVLGVNSAVDRAFDPVFKALWDGGGDIVRPGDGEGKMMAALSIDLETRSRVKFAGRMMAGAVVEDTRLQMAMLVTESLGNCPKYLNKKAVVPHEPRPELVGEGLPLPSEATELLDKADVFFLSSTDGQTMDTNHRGGPPGFVRLVKNNETGVELVFPEYSGNRLYQTLGNLKVNPLVGIAIPDFETADVLHLTGSASVLIGDEASFVLSRTQLAVKITVTGARFIKSSLPFRGSVVDYSPYNPPLRHLMSEKSSKTPARASRPDISAALIDREELTPTINRFTFRLSSLRGRIPAWQAGQHMTLDFDPEVGSGYAHMRDDDPQSLNDDHVRTFTISSPPPLAAPGQEANVQITARKHGPVTEFLWRHNLRVPLEIPVLGLAGEDSFRLGLNGGSEQVFIAAGVGITPLLAQARDVTSSGTKLRVLWSLRGEDLPFAVDTFKANPRLAQSTTLLVTTLSSKDVYLLEEVGDLGATVETRRLRLDDLRQFTEKRSRFYLCTGLGMRKALEEWLDGEDVTWEDFGY